MKQEPAESALVKSKPDLVGIVALSKGGEDVTKQSKGVNLSTRSNHRNQCA